MLSLRTISNDALDGALTLYVVSKHGRSLVRLEERDIPFPEINLELFPHYELDLRLEHGKVRTPMAVVSCLWQGRARPIKGTLKWLDGDISIAVPFGFLGGDGHH